MESIGKLAARGSAWTIGGYAGEQILRLISNLIVTRLLFPEAFGVVAIVWVLIHGLNMLSDVGIGPNVIRHEAGEVPSFLNTAWTIQIARGFALWVFSLLIAYPLSSFYQEPLLAKLIPVAGLTAVCDGFSSTSIYTMNRRLKLAGITMMEFIAHVFGLVVMNLWAWLHPTIWALVGSAVAARLLRTILSQIMLPSTGLRLQWLPKYGKDIFRFGKWVFLSSAMLFFSVQIDRLILGKLLPMKILGVYIIAWTLADAAKQIVVRLSSKVVFPALAQQSHLSREALRARIFQPRLYILLVLGIGLSIAVAFGDLFVELLYDDRYIQAGWMLPLLSLGLWPLFLTLTVSPSLYAIARPHYEAFGHSLRFLFLLAGIPAGFHLIGLPGAVIAIACGYVPLYSAITLGLCKEGLSDWAQDIKSTLLFVGTTSLLLLFRFACGWGTPLMEIYKQ